MNKALISNLEVMIAEGHSSHIVKLYHSQYGYKKLCDKIMQAEKEIETLVSEKNIILVKKYSRAQNNKAYFEQRFMYIQGMKDFSEIMRSLDNELLSPNLRDYDFKYDNEN